ncbi:DUF202 domain-containing protein [Aspergillus saccharolyticus JOP 1030-1]|uniref:DUF202 domain-containing protein n=1 Tax=Aspergillus saccharolyticus JOP 1030-1 TaxID=1450539 RepID=A0A318Z1T7_9EURO|nr:hypothetical protein BP01DRAFT_360666 [Aspergillus saccharolyticus JOP 1030-1]PYH41251.1 hypothetical protein BP01DRAFT_360666 [Aspergillus saccharolyticus JOP 1030-1]
MDEVRERHVQGDPITTAAREENPPAQAAAVNTGEHHRESQSDDDSDRDAFELRNVSTQDVDEAGFSTDSISSAEYRVRTLRTVSQASQRSRESRKGPWGRLERFWTRNVVLTVPQRSNRDHFALERTFLAYIRTSVMVAMQGVLIAQLFRLQHKASPDLALGFYEVGVPLSVTCYGAAIIIASLGAYRFWKQQSMVALGTVYAGGWELNLIGLLIGSIILATFIISIVITVQLANHDDR